MTIWGKKPENVGSKGRGIFKNNLEGNWTTLPSITF